MFYFCTSRYNREGCKLLFEVLKQTNQDFPLAFCAYLLHLEFALLYPEDGFVLSLHLPVHTTYHSLFKKSAWYPSSRDGN